MPRKKTLPKFKYTVRKKGDLYVKYPLEGLENPVWRRCHEETQAAVDEIIEEIKNDRAKTLRDSAVPDVAGKFFDYWLELVKQRVTIRTWQGYAAITRRYLRPALEKMQIEEIEPRHIQNVYKAMTERGLGAETVHKVHTVGMMIFNEAANHELIASNPVTKVKPPKIQTNLKIKAMNPAEVKKFLAACEDSPFGTVFAFALETGLRPSEYLALRWTDIDFETNTVSVVRGLVTDLVGGGYYFKTPKTRRSRRSVPISEQMKAKLLAHKETQNALLREVEERIHRVCKPSREPRKQYNKKLLENHEQLNLVFPSADFTPMKDTNLGKRYFKKIVKAAGLSEEFTQYHLRHSMATLLLQANVNPKIVSERLGHSSVAITLDTYSHVLPGMQESATEAISNFLYKD